jgi:hypothetical protein
VSGSTLSIEQILTLLTETPQRLATLTENVKPDLLRTAANVGDWSAVEVLAHLRSCADVWGNCIADIIRQDRPTIRAINPRTWIKKMNYRELEFQPSLQAFAAQRSELLDVLKSLPLESWSRMATVKGAGKSLERTVLFYAQWIATHERPHVKQITNIANTANTFNIQT